MFKPGDRVQVRVLASGDNDVGVFIGYTGTVTLASKNSMIDNAIYVIFDEKIESYNKDNGRYLPSENLELYRVQVPAKKVKHGFKIGDKVVVVRGSNLSILEDEYEQKDLDRYKLFGEFGVITDVSFNNEDNYGYDTTVKIASFTEGWGDSNSQWGINKHNLRRVVTK